MSFSEADYTEAESTVEYGHDIKYQATQWVTWDRIEGTPKHGP